MTGYEAYAPNELNVKVITAAYDEDLEMKVAEFLHSLDDNTTIINIHYTDNHMKSRYLSAIITYAIEEYV